MIAWHWRPGITSYCQAKLTERIDDILTPEAIDTHNLSHGYVVLEAAFNTGSTKCGFTANTTILARVKTSSVGDFELFTKQNYYGYRNTCC